MAPLVPGPMGTRAAWFLTGHWTGSVLMTASFTLNSLFHPPATSHKSHLYSVTKDRLLLARALFAAQLEMTNCIYTGLIGVVVEADSRDHNSSPWWEWQTLTFFSPSLFINYSHLHLMCRSPSPLAMGPSSSKAPLLGSVRASPGVAGPQTPAEWWVLRAWACLDQGLNFSSEDEEKVYGTLPWECLLLFEAPVLVAALILWKDYFISSCSFLSLLLLLLLLRRSLTFHQLRFCALLLGDLLLALALSPLISHFSISEYTHSSFATTPTLFPLLPLLHPTLFFFFSIFSILPFQHMTDCVINEHHKPLFLLATH